MKLRCRVSGHKWKLLTFVWANPDPHPMYIQGTFQIPLEKECERCGETWRSKWYEHWEKEGFEDKTSYRFHDHPEDVEEYNRTHCNCNCRCSHRRGFFV